MTFPEFIAQCNQTVYAEPVTPLHTELIPKVVAQFCAHLHPGTVVLDIGFGAGQSLEEFKKLGMVPVGITLLAEEVDAARAKGFYALRLDMHQLSLSVPGTHPASVSAGRIKAVFARHILEHSPCPAYVLNLLRNYYLLPGDWVYIEVPAPDTAAHHEANPNHYTCLTMRGWAHLILRSGYKIMEAGPIKFDLPTLGPDEYFWFVCQAK